MADDLLFSKSSQNRLNEIMGQRKRAQTASAKGGLTFSTTVHPYDGAEQGDGFESGTSIFDPVLCELAYRWFCPPGGVVLDPFAGGSVRGVVASKLGRRYVGVELRPEQVAANRDQGEALCDDPQPVWIQGDSRNIGALVGDSFPGADFLFSCPPYADLEVYSDDPADISTLGYAEFRAAYEEIIAAAAALLKPDRFACFVVGDVRGKDGFYYGFPWHTINAFEKAGLRLYNEAVLVTAVGSLPIRVGRQFEAARKLGKTHQNILVFCKGDPRAATEAIGPVEFGQAAAATLAEIPEDLRAPTPVERRGNILVKRDDLFSVAGVAGGKVRTCWYLAQGATGLVTAGSRASPQVNIVAHVAAALGVPCRAHTPTGALSPEVAQAQAVGAEIVQHKPGHNSVIVARARADAEHRNWREIPFGMECPEAVAMTAAQTANLPVGDFARLVIPVGSGMSLAGVLTGLAAMGAAVPVLGVVVGADPTKRLDRYAPAGWRDMVELVPAGLDYHAPAAQSEIHGLRLDPHYEAKCIPFLRPNDLLWVVGLRASATSP